MMSCHYQHETNAVIFVTLGDAYHLTSPSNDGRGAIRCMKSALRDANLRPDDICYINAHATSTPVGKNILCIISQNRQ